MNTSRLSYSSGLEVCADLCKKETNDNDTKTTESSSSIETTITQMKSTTKTTTRERTTTTKIDLGDNIEFFFKCNVGLEPDTRPYKEAIL